MKTGKSIYTKNRIGPSSFIRNPSRFFRNEFFVIPLYQIWVGVSLFCRTHVTKDIGRGWTAMQ